MSYQPAHAASPATTAAREAFRAPGPRQPGRHRRASLQRDGDLRLLARPTLADRLSFQARLALPQLPGRAA